MYDNETRRKLQNIISGVIFEEQSSHCTNARNYLCKSFSASTTVKKEFNYRAMLKKKQDEVLKKYADDNSLMFEKIPNGSRYIAEGGEAKIYLNIDNRTVIKINDGIYYNTWLDFLNSILIHNLLFSKTAYELLGFIEEDTILKAVLKQPYITSDAEVNLLDVKKLLEFNGFENTKRNDYYNKELGLILEDIHDENVITNSNTLFFIDTVFYINLVGNEILQLPIS